jgi:hypothetical protein
MNEQEKQNLRVWIKHRLDRIRSKNMLTSVIIMRVELLIKTVSLRANYNDLPHGHQSSMLRKNGENEGLPQAIGQSLSLHLARMEER